LDAWDPSRKLGVIRDVRTYGANKEQVALEKVKVNKKSSPSPKILGGIFSIDGIELHNIIFMSARHEDVCLWSDLTNIFGGGCKESVAFALLRPRSLCLPEIWHHQEYIGCIGNRSAIGVEKLERLA